MPAITSLTTDWHGGGNVFARPNMRESAGQEIQGHQHTFDHLAIFHTAWRVDAVSPEGREVTRFFPKNSFGLIRAEWEHKMTSLPHEVDPHQQALLDVVLAVATGVVSVDALLPAVAQWRKMHDWQPHTQWCIYAHRTPQGDVVQEYTGWSPAYR